MEGQQIGSVPFPKSLRRRRTSLRCLLTALDVAVAFRRAVSRSVVLVDRLLPTEANFALACCVGEQERANIARGMRTCGFATL